MNPQVRDQVQLPERTASLARVCHVQHVSPGIIPDQCDLCSTEYAFKGSDSDKEERLFVGLLMLNGNLNQILVWA